MKTKLRIRELLLNLLILIGITALCGMIFHNCQSIDNDIDSNLDIPKDYNKVGLSHNEGLDFIFCEIRNNCIAYSNGNSMGSDGEEPIDYKTIIRKAIKDFCETNSETKEFLVYYESTFDMNYLLKSSNVTEFQPDMKELLDRIQLAIRSELKGKNLNRLKKELNAINQMASEHLSPLDASAIYSATSTAYSSFQYWNKNYRAWYFALNYPEIMVQLEKSDLNKLSLKSSYSLMDTIPDGQSKLKTFWNDFEGWLNNTADALDYWWDEYGEKIIVSDCLGAVAGTFDAVTAAGAPSLVFGPEGLVVVGAAGAIVGGIDASAFAITGSGIIELTKP